MICERLAEDDKIEGVFSPYLFLLREETQEYKLSSECMAHHRENIYRTALVYRVLHDGPPQSPRLWYGTAPYL